MRRFLGEDGFTKIIGFLMILVVISFLGFAITTGYYISKSLGDTDDEKQLNYMDTATLFFQSVVVLVLPIALYYAYKIYKYTKNQYIISYNKLKNKEKLLI